MTKSFPIGWKRSYWPEPRLGRSKQTRGEAIRATAEARRQRRADARERALRADSLRD